MKAAVPIVRRNGGFTLIELLVSMAILTVLILVMTSMVNQSNQMWRFNRAKAEQFRSARNGFESLTRHLSQATLNTYWDYVDASGNPRTVLNNATFVPSRYIRQSELRFISGLGVAGNSIDSNARPTHSVFFQAPLGFTGDPTYRGLENMLNTWGYFIEYNSDPTARPSFVTSPTRKRFRLMEMMEPSESLSLYNYTSNPAKTAPIGTPAYTGINWFSDPLGLTGTNSVTHVLAENVIALVILPKLAPSDQTSGGFTDASMAPDYFYSSTGYNLAGTSLLSTVADKNLNPKNQIPPVVQVTIVSIDEDSAVRMGDTGSAALNIKIGTLFSNAENMRTDLTRNPQNPNDASLESYLISHRINYRIFTTTISIKAAKWSREQTN